MDNIEILKKEYLWVKDLIANNQLKVDIDHYTNFKAILTLDRFSLEQKYEAFLENFFISFPAEKQRNNKKFISLPEYCFDCGEHFNYLFENNTITCGRTSVITTENNQKEFVITTIPCAKTTTYSFEIDFPSGEIICIDRLPYVEEIMTIPYYFADINCKKGKLDRTMQYAKNNIFHIFVGNTCPIVFQNDDIIGVGHSHTSKYVYNNGTSDCDCGKKNCDCDIKIIPPITNGVEIGDICTDLWWATIIDVEIYKKLLIAKFGETKGLKYLEKTKPIQTKIKPGKYLCTYLDEEESKYPILYANLKLIK